MKEFVICRLRVLNPVTALAIKQYHSPYGWTRTESNAYHYDFATAKSVADKMAGAFPVYASSNFRSTVRRLGRQSTV